MDKEYPFSSWYNWLAIQAAVAMKEVYSLTMLSVSIQDSYGYGLAADGLYGISTINNCSFVRNKGEHSATERYLGGNFILAYENCTAKERTNVTISKSLFLNGSGVTERSKEQAYTDTLITPAVGIALFLSCTNVSVLLSGVQMRFNKANSGSSKGGNLFIFIGQVCNNVTLDDSLVANGELIKLVVHTSSWRDLPMKLLTQAGASIKSM